MAKDIYLQPNAPDPVFGDDLVLALVRRYVPDARAVTGVDESGGEARTYAVDANLILKTQRPHRLRPRTSLAKEVFFLNHLAACADVSIPRVLGHGRDGDVEYTLMTRMPGVAVVNTTLVGQARKETLRELGRTIHRIHQVERAALAGSGLFPMDRTFGDVQARFADSFATAIAKIHAEQRPWGLPMTPDAVAEQALAALPESDERVALHTNPGPTHTFVDAQTGAFSGVIDFGDAYIGHPAMDLRQWSRPEDRVEVLAGYTAEGQVSPAFLQTWRVVMMLADMIALAYYPERREQAEADLVQLCGGGV